MSIARYETFDLIHDLYGQGDLYETYADIEYISTLGDLLDKNTQNLLECAGIEQDHYHQRAIDLYNERKFYIGEAEQKLIDLSVAHYQSRTKEAIHSSVSIFLGYASLLSVLNPYMARVAESLALKVTSMMDGVPVITDTYTKNSNFGVISSSPQMAIRRRLIGENMPNNDETNLSFDGYVAIARLLNPHRVQHEDFIFSPEDLEHMVIGNLAVTQYMFGLELNGEIDEFHRLRSKARKLYRPLSAVENDLFGRISTI